MITEKGAGRDIGHWIQYRLFGSFYKISMAPMPGLIKWFMTIVKGRRDELGSIMQSKDQEQAIGEKVLDAGGEAAGSLVGVGVGLAIGGPIGAVVGALAGPVSSAFFKQAAQVAKRQLSETEIRRAGAVLAVAAAELKIKLDAGASVRTDGFFDKVADNRSAASEVIEAVVRAAESDPEERKLHYLGYLFANLAITDSVTRETANRIISIARRLSFSELRFLALFHVASTSENKFNLAESLPEASGNYNAPEASEAAAVIDPIWSLYSQHMLIGRGRSLGMSGIKPNELRSFGVGRQLAVLMELNRMPLEEIRRAAELIPSD